MKRGQHEQPEQPPDDGRDGRHDSHERLDQPGQPPGRELGHEDRRKSEKGRPIRIAPPVVSSVP